MRPSVEAEHFDRFFPAVFEDQSYGIAFHRADLKGLFDGDRKFLEGAFFKQAQHLYKFPRTVAFVT